MPKKDKKQYWMCLIGGVDPKKYQGNGADFPLRMAVRDAYLNMFGEGDEVCASGWGIDQERYDILRTLHSMSTYDLKDLLKNKTK